MKLIGGMKSYTWVHIYNYAIDLTTFILPQAKVKIESLTRQQIDVDKKNSSLLGMSLAMS